MCWLQSDKMRPSSPGNISLGLLHGRAPICFRLIGWWLMHSQLYPVRALCTVLPAAAAGLTSRAHRLSHSSKARVDEESDEDADRQCGVCSNDPPLAPIERAVNL